MKQLIIKILLTAVIVVLGYFVVDSIRKPVKFTKEKDKRENVVIQRLKDIRTAQLLFKTQNEIYANTWDTLIDFLEVAEIPIVKIIQDPDDTTFTKKISDTIGYIKAVDSLFQEHFNLGDLKKIPFSDEKIFELAAGEIEKGQVKVQVFEVKGRYEDILFGLPGQLVINLVAKMEQLDLYPGLLVGSMTEPSTDGNWEN